MSILLSRNIFAIDPDAFGLDISDVSLKIIQLKKKRKFLGLASWGEVKIKPGIVVEGEIKDEAALVEAIKELLGVVKGKKLKTNYVVASLPEQKAFLQIIQMPLLTPEELKTAIRFEAENYIPLPIEKVYLDFRIVPPFHDHKDHLDILIAALPKQTVNPYVSCLEKAGLNPVVLEIESLSVARALIKNEVSPFSVLLIDFGETSTGFTIFSGYSIRFTSSIAVASRELTQAIARVLKVDAAEAEKLKVQYGLQTFSENSSGAKERTSSPQKKITQKNVFNAMIPALGDLVEQIERYLNYYQTHAQHIHLDLDGKEVKKVLLCGRGANLKGLTDFFSHSLKIPTELGNSWINILPEPLKEVPELPFRESLGYTTALGLALRAARQDDRYNKRGI